MEKKPFDEILMKKLKSQHPEIKDCYIPERGEHRFVIISMIKEQAGQSKMLIQKVCEFLQPYLSVKFIVLCDSDVNVHDWNDIIWAVTTRMDPVRDSVKVACEENSTSILGLDATNKFKGEVLRDWGTPIVKDPGLVAKIDSIWDTLAIL